MELIIWHYIFFLNMNRKFISYNTYGFVSVFKMKLPKTEKQFIDKIREEFVKNSNVRDVRVIDMMVAKVCFILLNKCNYYL